MPIDEPNQSTALSPSHDVPNNLGEAAQALRNGPIGAYIVAGIAVGLLFIGWLVFYFFLFMPRGSIG
jgi:F0F1-type ATP synthase assembly protein I